MYTSPVALTFNKAQTVPNKQQTTSKEEIVLHVVSVPMCSPTSAVECNSTQFQQDGNETECRIGRLGIGRQTRLHETN